MTDERHTNDTTNGQRVSRHALPTQCFLFFPTAHFLKTILASRTNGTFGFSRHTSRPFTKPKEPFFANADKQIIKLDNNMLKRNVQYIAPFVSINTTFDTLNNLTAGATL